MSVLTDTLQKHFGYSAFRPLQEEIISGVLGGRDTFVLMPTGGGKSLCYQLPALLLPGLTVVVSPLIALMKDQVDGLREAGIAATYINSTLSAGEIAVRRQAILDGSVKLLYAAPERLVLPDFLALLGRIELSLLAVDEAHCISEWGHDFRVEYRQLSLLRDRFPDVPIIAMTATATDRVRNDIITQLKLREDFLSYRASFDRENLYYGVKAKKSGYDDLLEIVAAHRGETGIIYCQSRDRTEEVASTLRAHGYRALPYHAGLERETRAATQEQFDRDDVDIVCATIAFGMGIDKPNVRYVVHVDLPKNLMGYYQETGRGGRDGLPSECILFFSYADKVRFMRFIDEKPDPADRRVAIAQLEEMVGYAESTICRRKTLLAYFGEEYPHENCGNCDICTNPEALETFDATRPTLMFLSCIVRLKESFGAAYVIDILRGSNNRKILSNRHHLLPTYNIGRDLSKDEWRWLGHALISNGYLTQSIETYNALKLTARGWDVLRNKGEVTLSRPRRESRESREAKPKPSRAAADLPTSNRDLFERLRALRRRIADQHEVPAYIIFDDKTLHQMASRLPSTMGELLGVHGVGEVKAARYGREFVDEINRFLRESPGAAVADVPPPPAPSERKTPSAEATGDLYRAGLTAEEIAERRGLVIGTIFSHLIALAAAGELEDIEGAIPPDKIAEIREAFGRFGTAQLTSVMEFLGSEHVSFDELRLVRAFDAVKQG